MKKFIFPFFIFIALISEVMAQSDVSPARWKSKDIIIDGVANDWVKPLNFYDDQTGLNFAICNDQRTLYFIFTCPDEMKMRRVMSAGWTLQLISKGKQSKFKASLLFPLTKINWMGDRRDRDPLEKKIVADPLITTYKSQITSIEAKGFGSNQHELMLNDRNGINIAIGADSLQHIVYEMAIPLKELFTSGEFQPNEVVTLNITVNAMERAPTDSGAAEGFGERGGRSGGGGSIGRSGGGRSMGGGRSGGGMSRGGGSRGMGSGQRSGLFEKASFKQKFTLVRN